MIGPMAARESTIGVIRGCARIRGTAVAILWGAFFVEHLEWFVSGDAPPA